ncbi:MAG: leucine-rich repeat protein, partial [Trueperaceae bacterium]|nr:leucine-rich repeat protein [Trueperaceae bacterium]
MKHSTNIIKLMLLVMVLILASCSPNRQQNQVPDFRLQLASDSLSIKQGETGTVVVSLSKSGGFNSEVALSLEGNPTGVNGNFDPASISDSSTLSLSVAASAALGETNLTIKGTVGSLVKTASLKLTVTETSNPNPNPNPNPDTTRPTVLSTFAPSSTTVEVSFSEAIKGVETNQFDFPAQSLTISAASLGTDSKTVTLTTSPQTPNESYALLVKTGITDLAGNPFDLAATNPLATSFLGFNPDNANLQILIGGLPEGVNASIQISGPNNFQQTITASTTLTNLAIGTYSFLVNDVKPDSATFGKSAETPTQVELVAGATNIAALGYTCTLVSPPDTNLDAVLKEKTGKDTYNCDDLAALTELFASSRAIQSIEGLQYARGLTKLFLDNNQIANLPDGIFDDLTNLTSLELANNKLVDLSNGPFDKLSGLTILTLTTNQLTSLPDHVFDALSSLTSLSLSLNKLNSLPLSIFDQLSQLKFLSLDRNSLSSLPIGIFAKLSALSELNLQGNKLTSLPVDSFDKLSNLNDLLLGDNQLTNLPNNSFDNLTNLTDLGL